MRLLYETGYFNAKDLRKLDQLYISNESLSTLYSLYCILIYIQSAYLQPEPRHSFHIDYSSRPEIYL